MEYYQNAKKKKWIGLLALLVLFWLQLILSGYIQIDPSSKILGYKFSIASDYKLGIWQIVGIFLFSTIFVYFVTFLVLTSQTEGFVLIYGKNSLYSKFVKFLGADTIIENVTANQINEFIENEYPKNSSEYKNYLEIALISKQLMDKADVNIVERIYVGKSNIANAFALRVIPIPWIGQDWIIINRNLSDILETNEIEAVIAHELGHVKNYDSWMSLLFYYPRVLMSFSWFYVLIVMFILVFAQPLSFWTVLARIIVLLFVISLISRVTLLTAKVNSVVSQNTELLADYFATTHLVTAETLTNALVKLGQRGEVLRAIKTEIEWLESKKESKSVNEMVLNAIHFLDPSEMNVEKGRNLALEYYVSNQLTSIIDFLKLKSKINNIDQLVNHSLVALKKERGKKDAKKIDDHDLSMKEIRQLTQDWRDSDLNKDNYLQKSEIKHLVENMRETGYHIFETDVLIDMNIIPSERTHPPISKRVEYLYETFMRDELED